MTTNTVLKLSFISLILSGCNATNDACDSTNIKKAIYQQLTEQTLATTSKKRNDYFEGPMIFGASKIRESLALIDFDLINIALVNHPQNSSTYACTGQLNVSIPPPMYADAEWVLETQRQLKIKDISQELSINNTINIFTQEIKYSIDSAADNKHPIVQFNGNEWVQLLDTITTALLIKSTPSHQEIKLNPLTKNQVQKTESPKTILPSSDKNPLVVIKKPLMKANEVEVKQAPLQKPSANRPITPSFNCSKATKPTDITICAKPVLATLDVENMQHYKNAKIINPAFTKEIWKASIKAKYACKTDVDCIEKNYKKSIQRYQCTAAKNKSC